MSSEPVSQSEFNRAWDALRDDIHRGFTGMNSRLDTLNGQTRRHGEAIVVLEHAVQAVKDAQRAVEEVGTATRPSKKQITGVASVAAGGAYVLVEVGKAVWHALRG